MNSIVLDLQKEVIKPDCDIVNVLRKAHLIAVKLGLKEFDKWISCELNGYNISDAIPNYREVMGELQAFNPYRGWLAVLIDSTQTQEKICKHKIRISISEIKELCLCKNDSSVLVHMPSGNMQAQLNRLSSFPIETQFRIEFSITAVGNIMEMVKNTILEWTIKLEAEGILGEEMQFDAAEIETAKKMPQTIINYYGNTNVINAPMERSAVIAGNDNSVELTNDRAKDIIAEVETSLKEEDLPAEDQENATEMLEEIKEKVSEQKKPSVIKAALVGLKDYLIGVGASATVALIQAKMQGLL